MKPLFTEKQIGISAILGGPIPPGILFYLNYKRIDKEKEAYISLAATLIFSFGLFFTLMKVPADVLDKIPNALFSSLYGILVYIVYKTFLSKEIEKLFVDGRAKASNWSVAGVTLGGLVITTAIILGLAFNQPPFGGEKITYGATGHEIYINEDNVESADANKLGLALADSGYFTDEYPVAVHWDLDETGYLLTLQIDSEFWTDEEVLSSLNDLKIELEELFSNNVTIILEQYDLAGKRSVKRI